MNPYFGHWFRTSHIKLHFWIKIDQLCAENRTNCYKEVSVCNFMNTNNSQFFARLRIVGKDFRKALPMGIILLLFWTYFVHEQTHSLVCAAYGGTINYISLFPPGQQCSQYPSNLAAFLGSTLPYAFDLGVLITMIAIPKFLKRKVYFYVVSSDILINLANSISSSNTDFGQLFLRVGTGYGWLALIVALTGVILFVRVFWQQITEYRAFFQSENVLEVNRYG